ncbi:growth-regulating factor 2-like [Impatiens glandulifera]|uniref:growth-regulating factor 2-like n=1 Tax=Impatiens glandulifera TaxID=253017 RepID=UPI001FB11AC5|nr:growth-regulating factor 2-like [Impatiens glandulifera]
MDLEIVGFDALLGSETTAYLSSSSSSIPTSDSDQKQRLHGSGWNLPKHYSQDFSLRSTINGGNSIISENGQQMLSFSSPTSQMPPSAYGYGGLFNRMRGPFTQSQWMELENQALIYKYINANAPVPSNLLIPIIKASHYAHFPPFSVGWAPFHLRFSNSTDPEPGRCRRTDGKKWRCAKDAVPDQKYCERHMNRGRHRSRKPVENQTGHSVSTAAASKMVVPTAVPADGLSLSQPGGAHRCPSSSNGNRVFLNRENNKLQDSFSQSTIYPSSNLKQTQFLDDPNQQTLCCSPTTYGSSYHNINGKDQYGLKSDDIQHERTQLSISIPVTSDFMSKEPSTKMGLGVGLMENETSSQKQASWIPVSWGSNNANSIGGPLGEVLNKTNRHSSALDLMSVHQ